LFRFPQFGEIQKPTRLSECACRPVSFVEPGAQSTPSHSYPKLPIAISGWALKQTMSRLILRLQIPAYQALRVGGTAGERLLDPLLLALVVLLMTGRYFPKRLILSVPR
jgi:hypothetical protein